MRFDVFARLRIFLREQPFSRANHLDSGGGVFEVDANLALFIK